MFLESVFESPNKNKSGLQIGRALSARGIQEHKTSRVVQYLICRFMSLAAVNVQARGINPL